jgi:hypothetical protein
MEVIVKSANDNGVEVDSDFVNPIFVECRGENLEVVIDTDVELAFTGSTPHSRIWYFTKGDITTSVTLFADNKEEVEKVKGNMFQQRNKGQYIFLIVPWKLWD